MDALLTSEDERAQKESAENDAFHSILAHLKRRNGFDLSGYKPASVRRRVAFRMREIGIGSFGEYLAYLKTCREEFPRLIDTILINVTEFFRDPLAWKFLARKIIPRIIKSKCSREKIRIWSAGCAAGQEAYSLAILLAEALGADRFRERVTIFGTDVDDAALARARRGNYTSKELMGLAQHLKSNFFYPRDGCQVFRSDLRPLLIFGHHNLLCDPPFAHIDLIACRNTLMYFNAKPQRGVLAKFHRALNPNGYLFLGMAEVPLDHAELFRPVDFKHHVFAKVPNSMPLPPRGRLQN